MSIIIDYAVETTPIDASTIIDRCGRLLLDESHVRWTEAELLDWINEAVAEIINLRPDAGETQMILPLSEGVLQRLPADGVQLLDVLRNVGTDGETPGRAITRTERTLLDSCEPDWHTKTKKTEVRHFTYDDRTPRIFYTYPPVVGDTRVELIYSALPALVEDTTNLIGLANEYAAAIVNYVCYRANSKDSEFANAAVATGFYQAFMASIGNEAAGAQATSPNQARP